MVHKYLTFFLTKKTKCIYPLSTGHLEYAQNDGHVYLKSMLERIITTTFVS